MDTLDPYFGADASNTTKAAMFAVQGVDVSSNNGKFDFATAVRDGNVRFAFARCSLGYGDADSLFQRNWAEMAEQGILRGAYHFAYPSTIAAGKSSTDDARDEAMYFCEQVLAAEHALGVSNPCFDGRMLPPVLDYEPTNDPALTGQRDWIDTWIRTTQDQLRRGVLLYTGDNVWKQQVGGDAWLTGMPLWVPHYANITVPTMKPWTRWVMWQWSGGGSGATYRQMTGQSFPGVVSGQDVDLNAFWGTPELLALLGQPSYDRWLLDASGNVGANPHATAPSDPSGRPPALGRANDWVARHRASLLTAQAAIAAALADLDALERR